MRQTGKENRKWMMFSIVALCCAVAVFIGAFLVFMHVRENRTPYTTDQVTKKMISGMKLSDLVKVRDDQISKHYNIPEGVISDCSVYMSKSPESASELACFLLTGPEKYDELKDSVTAHINVKSAGFKSLNPTQYNALKNYLIVQNGRYVLVAVGNNTEIEEKWFRSLTS